MKTSLHLCVSFLIIVTFLFVLRGTSSGPLLYNALMIKQPKVAFESTGVRTPRPYMIPSDKQLGELNGTQLFDIYWTYINTVQVLCMNQTRLGSVKDGGKEVCIDESFKPKQPCIVYSFGSYNQFDFEIAIATQFKCEIHTFDPSRKQRKWNIPASVQFHDIGIRGYLEGGSNLKTLSMIKRELKHEQATIDVLKVDVESAEWKALPEMIESGSLQNVKQMCIELHFDKDYVCKEMVDQLRTLRKLYEYGFHIFMRERNPAVILDNKTPITELSMINTKWTTFKASARLRLCLQYPNLILTLIMSYTDDVARAQPAHPRSLICEVPFLRICKIEIH